MRAEASRVIALACGVELAEPGLFAHHQYSCCRGHVCRGYAELAGLLEVI